MYVNPGHGTTPSRPADGQRARPAVHRAANPRDQSGVHHIGSNQPRSSGNPRGILS